MTAHAAANTSSNELRAWQPLMGSADADLLPELGTLVSRSTDLARNDGVAAGAQQTFADNVIGGAGLRLSARPMHALLGKDKAWAREFARQAEAFFHLWWSDTACDACDEQDGAGLTNSVARSLWLTGEACAIPLWLPEPGALFATKLLLIDPARLSNPSSHRDSPNLRAGVARSEIGKALGYWVRKTHPGDRYHFGLGAASVLGPDEWEYIPARTPWGRRRFIHVHDKDRTGATRGKPILSAVMEQFKMLSHYKATELKASIVNALIAAFVKTPLDQESLVELFGGNPDAAAAYLDGRTQSNVALKGGAIIPLQPGEDLVPFTPARPASGFESFVMSCHRHIAAGLNMPYELLLKDFTKTNYSSARAALLEAWRYFNGMRRKIAQQFCQQAYLLVLEEMADRKLVDAPDFWVLQRAYAASRWIGPGRGWVDPAKEADAAEARLRNNLSTLEAEAAEQGLDWEELLEQRAIELARIAELEQQYGVSLSAPAPAKAPGGNPYPSDEEEAAGEDGAASDDKTSKQGEPATQE
jgi:lambda family phage portal protein